MAVSRKFTMVLRKLIIVARPLMPMLIGLCLGIALSLLFAPLIEESCFGSSDVDSGRSGRSSRRTKSVNNFDYGNGDAYEPNIKVLPKLEQPNGQALKDRSKKILRPRYASTELGIKEKLFVGVLTSRETIDSLGVAINKTLTHYVPKLVFFMDTRGPNLPSGMAVVSFSDEKPYLRPFHMLKYLAAHYAQAYDYYMFIPDTTYVRGEKLLDMLSYISIRYDIMFGRLARTEEKQPYCNLDSGLILSQNYLTRVVENLDWCIQHALATSAAENLGRCINHATSDAPCLDKFQDKNFTTYIGENLSFDDQRNPLQDNPEFQKALTVHEIQNDVTMYKIHRYFCQEELKLIQKLIQAEKESIYKIAPKTPDRSESLTWPIGVDPPNVPKTRFEVIRWEYFTETHVYLDNEFTNIRPLKGVHKEDVEEIIATAVQHLSEKYSRRYRYTRLVNGYRRFEPVRGMEYKVDLQLFDKELGIEVTKRLELIRPLSHVEIVPMPYVTESSRVYLILPVTVSNKDGVVSFLDSYAHTCLDSGDNTNLFVIFIYEQQDYKGSRDDTFSMLKSMISYYESKYMNGDRIAWTALQSNNPTQFNIIDAISKRYEPGSLFMLCTVGMELSIEFLNRVRMNTIQGWQVFFPIGFWQYKPNLIYDENPYPTTIEINRNVGHFDEYNFEHASFYNADYVHARRNMFANMNVPTHDLFDMFIKHHTLHVFRAVEPALIHKYREVKCDPSLSETVYSECLASRAEGLASRSQLAMLIFEHQQKLDQGHMNVIHQQNDPNVDQMKPNMLK